ncbi:FAD:protein FMN transferase [candidate division KSB1 bacterium]|nr:FAD:protein FMN transferase [candidate division KSB1 bacterium]
MLALVVGAAAIAICRRPQEPQPFESTVWIMDTAVVIHVFDQNLSRDAIESAITAAEHEIKRIDSLADFYSTQSAIACLNRFAGIEPVIVDSSMVSLLIFCERISELSGGAFDPAIAPLKKLWGFGERDMPMVPDSAAVVNALDIVNQTAIDIDSPRVFLGPYGAALDVGGVAKGYAVDRAIAILFKKGIQDAMVDAGGDLRTISGQLTRGKRRIYIRHPRDRNRFWGRFPHDVGAVATSGDYERFFLHDSLRYHHILDPLSGYPARECVSVTVQSPFCALSDALSTACFVLGPQRGFDLLCRLPRVEGVMIYAQGDELKDRITPGLMAIFERLP